MRYLAILTVFVTTSTLASEVYRCEKNQTSVQSALSWISGAFGGTRLPATLEYTEGSETIRVETLEPDRNYPQHGNLRIVRNHPVVEESRSDGQIFINVYAASPVSAYLCELNGAAINPNSCISEKAYQSGRESFESVQLNLENGSASTPSSWSMIIQVVDGKPYTRVLYREHVLKNAQSYVCRHNNAIGNSEIRTKDDSPFIPTIIDDVSGAQGDL